MLSAGSTAPAGTPAPPSTLKLRVDNVYYCYPKFTDLSAGDHVIFYEPTKDGGLKAALGTAVVQETLLAKPKTLHDKFASRGVYTLSDIKRHGRTSDGNALAIHFEMFEPFATPVGLADLRTILANRTNVQGLTKITRDQFEQIRVRGLS